jgi:hypothetical protein
METLCKILFYRLRLIFVEYELFAEGAGERLLRQIVARGAKAARGYEYVRALLGYLHGAFQPFGIVPDDGVEENVSPVPTESCDMSPHR